MRLVTYAADGRTRAGRVEGDSVVALDAPDVGALLQNPQWRDAAAAPGERRALSGVELRVTVPAPSKILCVGLNYAEHVNESRGGAEAPRFPTLFAKFADTLCGPADPIAIPPEVECPDWEAELVVVIGATVRRADERAAIAAIAGYAVGNDVSMRDWQRRTPQWLQGKMWERTSPVGPLVTSDEVGGDGRPDLRITCDVDGVVRQDARTSQLIFDGVHCVQYASTVVTLRPGDLLFTGTCGGVASARTPPPWLRPGQRLTTTIEGLGSISNDIVAA